MWIAARCVQLADNAEIQVDNCSEECLVAWRGMAWRGKRNSKLGPPVDSGHSLGKD